jgi:hypothetical protein
MLKLPAVWPRLGKVQASPHPVVCGVVAATCTRSARRRRRLHQHQHAATADWRKERSLTPPITGDAGKLKRRCSKGSPREHPRLQREWCSLQNAPLHVCPSRRRSGVRERISGSLKHVRFQWQLRPQRNPGPLRHYSRKSAASKSVSSGSKGK